MTLEVGILHMLRMRLKPLTDSLHDQYQPCNTTTPKPETYKFKLLSGENAIATESHSKFIRKSISPVMTSVCSKTINRKKKTPAKIFGKHCSTQPDQAVGPKGIVQPYRHEILAMSRSLGPQNASKPGKKPACATSFWTKSLQLATCWPHQMIVSPQFSISNILYMESVTWATPQFPEMIQIFSIFSLLSASSLSLPCRCCLLSCGNTFVSATCARTHICDYEKWLGE